MRRPTPSPPPLVVAMAHWPAVVATTIEASFAERVWASQTFEGAPCFRAVLIRRGAGVFSPSGGAPLEVSGPTILWAPFSARGEFRLRAGAEGATFLARQDLVDRIVAENPLGSQIRGLIDRPLHARSDLVAPTVAEIHAIFVALARETRDPALGTPVMITAYLNLFLMHLWRGCGVSDESDALAVGAPTAQHFLQLVEMHYRDNLGVDAFARMLGVTRSRLHNACLRALGKPPHKIVRERTLAEAKSRLRETSQPIEQIAYGLGFRDPAYFNRVFRRQAGLTPGAYRKLPRAEAPREATSYAAWP